MIHAPANKPPGQPDKRPPGPAREAATHPGESLGGESALIAACRQGQRGALEQLVEHFQAEVFGTVLRLVRNRDAALELTNAIFFKVYQNLASFDPDHAGRPFRPWLLRIATNEALNWLRSRRREREHVLSAPASAEAVAYLPADAQAAPDPEAVVLAAEQRATLQAALAQLPARYRLVLTLRFFNDLSYQEIAAHTGQDENAVGVQLLRARRLLKRVLAMAPHVVSNGSAGGGAVDEGAMRHE